jgi:SAM-dependent methyltransferase
MRRSVELARAFRVEQSDPHRFYDLLARDSVRMVGHHADLRGRVVVDVGAGPPEFADAFASAGAYYVAVDSDPEALHPAAHASAAALVGEGERLPIRSGSVDVAFSSNVFEHARSPEALGDELVRVTRRGGLVVVSYTNWLSPWGGHETSPFHYFGGEYAVHRYRNRHGHEPKNRVGATLFRTSVAQGLRWARTRSDAQLVDARPRYYPGWTRPLVSIPGLREVATWNLWLVLRRR